MPIGCHWEERGGRGEKIIEFERTISLRIIKALVKKKVPTKTFGQGG